MKARTISIFITGVVLTATLLSACSPLIGGPQTTALPPVTPTTQPEQTSDLPISEAAEYARITLAEKLRIDPGAVVIQSISPVEWADSCLGAPQPDEMCAEVITPGFVGILIAGQVPYEFHADQTGQQLRFTPGAALGVRQILAQQLGLLPDQIVIVSAERVEWPDACLGIQATDTLCTQVITPGFKIVLEAQDARYVYHTNESSSVVRLASAPELQPSAPVVTWTLQTSSGCEVAAISQAEIAFGPCGGALMPGRFASGLRNEDLIYFLQKYTSFESDTPAGHVVFAGQGPVTATQAEQRMIAEWARLTMQEAQAGRGGAAWGLAFAWHREGGIAGFCDDVGVYVTGEFYVSSCKSGQPSEDGRLRLTAAQLATVYTWLDQFQQFEYEHSDPASADALKIYMTFSGQGQQPADLRLQNAMLQMAEALFAQAHSTPDPEA